MKIFLLFFNGGGTRRGYRGVYPSRGAAESAAYDEIADEYDGVYELEDYEIIEDDIGWITPI